MSLLTHPQKRGIAIITRLEEQDIGVQLVNITIQDSEPPTTEEPTTATPEVQEPVTDPVEEPSKGCKSIAGVGIVGMLLLGAAFVGRKRD